jgi:hypothetical protein
VVDDLAAKHELNKTGSTLVFAGGSAGGVGAISNYE